MKNIIKGQIRIVINCMTYERGGQGVTFPAGLRVLPAGNLGISQEIQPKCLVVPPQIVSEGGKRYVK